MLIGFGFRAAVQAERIADPVAAVLHGHAAPLVAVLVLVHMLIWDAQNVQTQSGGPGTPGTGCCAQYKITVGVVVMVGFHRVSHGAIIHHRTQGRGNAVKLVSRLMSASGVTTFSAS